MPNYPAGKRIAGCGKMTGGYGMHVDTFARLKTPEVLTTEITARETQCGDLFDRLAAGTVEMLRPEVKEIRPGVADVHYTFIVRPEESSRTRINGDERGRRTGLGNGGATDATGATTERD